MAATLYRSSDVPNFDTYPSNQPEPQRLKGARGNSALEQRARQIGTVLGTAVSTLRKAQVWVQEIGSETTESAVNCINDLAETAKSKAQELSQATATRIQQLRETAQEKAEDMRDQAKAGYYKAKLRANQISRDYPFQVVVAAGVLGLLVGVTLRIWRSNRAY
jgi:ElaB/YqjD/DUF883 family membrane-anchored ribosome-binding protein